MATKTAKKEEYITVTGLIEKRGWTRSMATKLLQNLNCKVVDNPRYRCAAPMTLYYLKDIKRIEKTKKFAQLKEKAEKRKISAKKAVETKIDKTVDIADTFSVTVERIDLADLEEFTLEEKNNLIQRLQDEYCLDLYPKLEERGIDRQNIPTILLNTITRSKDFEVTENDTEQTIKEKRLKQYDRILNENIEDLNKDLSIERIERFLGYYDVEGTRIKLRPYQQRAADNAKEILRDNRFASVILPTGAGKSFVALSQLMEHKDEEILYLAPQNEIIEQMKDYIIKYIHGPVNTIRKK